MNTDHVIPTIKALMFASLMWEFGWFASLGLYSYHSVKSHLSRYEKFIILPLAVAGLTAQTVVVAAIITLAFIERA